MGLKVVSIVGARPQFIKAAVLLSALKKRRCESILVHTGQHYDYKMSALFFTELNMPRPKYNLGVGSGSHAMQTADMLRKIEKVLLREGPDLVIVYGDTNSTLAGALAASKLNIPIAHVEAGLRSFDLNMPEEINRILTDRLSKFLFCPSKKAVDNLRAEGIKNGVYLCGDVMIDALKSNIAKARKKSILLKAWGLSKKDYYLATIHRPSNSDSLCNLKSIFDAFDRLPMPVFLPMHPRTQKKLKKYFRDKKYRNIIYTNPVGYLDMLFLIENAFKVLTDSGGIQKEAYFLGVPCVTLRQQTEWTETLLGKWNMLAGCDSRKIVTCAMANLDKRRRRLLYGNGSAAKKIAKIILEECT